jgi:hypothetical protein
MEQRCGGACEGNLFLRNPLGLVFGTGGAVHANVVLDSCDIDGIDDPPRGTGIQVTGGSTYDVMGNLCAFRTTPGTWNIVAFDIAGDANPAQDVWLTGNVGWNWRWQGSGQALRVCVGSAGTFHQSGNRWDSGALEVRSLRTFMWAIGRPQASDAAALAEYCAQARQLRRGRLRREFLAAAAVAYERTGWGM